MREGEVQIVRPAGVTGDDLRCQVPISQVLFQRLQRLDSQPVVLRQRADEAVAAVRAEPDGVACEQVFVVDAVK